MDKSFHYIIARLKVLSKISAGQKLVVGDSNIQIMESSNNWDRFVKWWLGETRYTTLDKLGGFYREVRDCISELLEYPEQNKSNLERLNHEMSSGLRGLNNLMLSYQDDHTIVSQMETLSENFQIEKEKIEKIIKKLNEDIEAKCIDSNNPFDKKKSSSQYSSYMG